MDRFNGCVRMVLGTIAENVTESREMFFSDDERVSGQTHMDDVIDGHADYIWAYHVNITGDEYLGGISRIKEDIADEGISASELFDAAAEHVPSDMERNIYMEYIDRYNLLNVFKSGRKSVSPNHNYNICGRQMFLTTTINMYKNPHTGDVEGIMYLFDMSHQYVEKKIQSLLIGRQFESISLIRVSSVKFSIMSQFLYLPEGMDEAAVKEVDYISYIREVAEKYIVPEESELYIFNSSISNLTERLKENDSYYFTVTSVDDNGEKKYKKFSYYYIDDKKDTIVSTMEDVTGVIETDSLTGLYNRRGFVREAEKCIKDSGASGINYAVLFINIKNFKMVNEVYGIDGGDMILRAAAASLKKSFLNPVVLARSEADHFLCLADMNNIDYDKLCKMLHVQYTINGKTIELHGLCGVYMVKDSELDINRMCDRAKMAKDHVADIHVQPYAVYEPSMVEAYMEKALSVSSVNNAIDNKEFRVYFQPVFDVNTEKVVSAEALVRWKHPELGFISPDKFIPALEETGLVSKLDMYVFTETHEFIKGRIEEGKYTVPVSTNLSWMDFYDTDMIESMIADLKQLSHPHGYIRFEVTETSYAGMAERNHSVLETFRNMGAHILIDDFGSGYSSFSTITDYNFDLLKLDMGFVKKIGKNTKIGSVIHSIIDMAHHMDIRVIAEGAETKEQVDFLRKHGCDYVQGFYYSKPLSMEEFADMLDRQ